MRKQTFSFTEINLCTDHNSFKPGLHDANLMREARCARLPHQTADSPNCLHDPHLMRKARRNRLSRQSIWGRYGINTFGSISLCSCIVIHYCDVLNIEEEKERKNATKTKLVVAKNGVARNTFTRCETNNWITFDARQKLTSFHSSPGCLVLIRESREETLHTFILV